jgi:hypothetical protein
MMKYQAISGVTGVAAVLAAMAVASPGVASAANTGLFSGTYVIAPFGDTVHVTSECPECDAVGTGPSATVVMNWNGVGWQRTQEIAGCGTATGVGTPTVVVDGYVQELTLVSVGTCPAANLTAVWTRVGP